MTALRTKADIAFTCRLSVNSLALRDVGPFQGTVHLR
jgi:hypothetical protein